MIGDLRTLDDLAVREHHVAVDEGREAVGLNARAIDVDPLELLGGAKQLGEITPRIASASAACASTSSGFAATKVTLGAATCISGIHPTPMPVTTIFFCCASRAEARNAIATRNRFIMSVEDRADSIPYIVSGLRSLIGERVSE